jgi:mRNA-degrading endonuclease toxin of MazEF toxin-antitoxin module
MKIRFGHLYAADMKPRVRSKSGKIRPVVVIQSSAVIEAVGRTVGGRGVRNGSVPNGSRGTQPPSVNVMLPSPREKASESTINRLDR